jgi:endonuclease YncB( thermonuclease family)
MPAKTMNQLSTIGVGKGRMQKGKRAIISLLILIVFCQSAVTQTQTITGKVVSVADGDTITVLDANNQQRKIRLNGIDAPESNQDFGRRSKESLTDPVFGKTVTVDSTKTDRYGRIVCKVTLNGKDINLEQINRGMAWFYREYARKLSLEDAKAYDVPSARQLDTVLRMSSWRAKGTRLFCMFEQCGMRISQLRHGI